MTIEKSHFNLNRPVHLARRDIFFEMAVELLCAPFHEMSTTNALHHIENVLAYLQTATRHGTFAARSPLCSERERDFIHFLHLISQNVQSLHAMMLNQSHLGKEESFLCQFLNTNHEESALPAMAYGRRAEDILQGLWHVLHLALAPYRTLQLENMENLNEGERSRYERASASTRNELSERPNAPPVPVTI
ncbi:MAG: hypothetical protein EOM20_11690 [Spartobacteria bacterium]|nr:hypothetical protein [Spartobacteria bacterium]